MKIEDFVLGSVIFIAVILFTVLITGSTALNREREDYCNREQHVSVDNEIYKEFNVLKCKYCGVRYE